MRSRQKSCSFIDGRSLKGRDRAREGKVMGGAMVEGIKWTYIHAPAWHANRQKLYRQAYDMSLVDTTSNGSRIVLENSLGACNRLSTGQANNPTPFTRPTRPSLLPYNSLLPVGPSFHITLVQLLQTLLQNPWPPKSPWSPLSTRLDVTSLVLVMLSVSILCCIMFKFQLNLKWGMTKP